MTFSRYYYITILLFYDYFSIVLDGEQQYIYTEQTELTLLTEFTAPNSLIRAGFGGVKRVYLALGTQLLVVEIEHQMYVTSIALIDPI